MDTDFEPRYTPYQVRDMLERERKKQTVSLVYFLDGNVRVAVPVLNVEQTGEGLRIEIPCPYATCSAHPAGWLGIGSNG